MFGWLKRLILPEVPVDPAPARAWSMPLAPSAPVRHPTGNTELDPVTGREIPKQSET